MTNSEKLTYCTTKITCVQKDENICTGTGFFMEFNPNFEAGTAQPVIITNKHVVEEAKKIIYSVCMCDKNNNPLDQDRFTITLEAFKIINHPDKNVDLCAILIASVEKRIHNDNTNIFTARLGTDTIIKSEEMIKCSAMEDIIMIGYPNGLEDNYNNKPIIRRGITATHIKFNYNGKKEFLIDMACFPGSSGSPIFICNDSTYTTQEGLVIGSRIKLLGILYAGPYHTSVGNIIFKNIDTNPKAILNIPNNLGLVIKAERIKELENIMSKIS